MMVSCLILIAVYMYPLLLYMYFPLFLLSLPPSLSLLPSTIDPLLLVDNEDIIEGGGGGGGMQYINTHTRRDQHSALLVSKRSGSNDLIFQQQKGKET